jgi:tetraacyldisaccharide 4'-kinase
VRVPLQPLGALFGRVTAVRRGLYRRGLLPQRRLGCPVISVGNLSVGGSGKTPVVARVATLLKEAGLPVAILSRGYRGSFQGRALVVSDGSRVYASSLAAGDEPVMLARDLPGVIVAVGRRRDVVGAEVLRRFGRQVLVLDDAFQHLRLFRDLDIVCLDALTPDDLPLPAGRLREPMAAARRADVLLLTEAHRAEETTLAALEAQYGPDRTFRVGRRCEGFRSLAGEACPAPQRPFVVSAIARPERLERDVLEQCGAMVGRIRASDHHRFRERELLEAASRAGELGADAIVVTAKDAVRLPERLPEAPPVRVFRTRVEIRDEAGFRQRLLAVAARVG